MFSVSKKVKNRFQNTNIMIRAVLCICVNDSYCSKVKFCLIKNRILLFRPFSIRKYTFLFFLFCFRYLLPLFFSDSFLDMYGLLIGVLPMPLCPRLGRHYTKPSGPPTICFLECVPSPEHSCFDMCTTTSFTPV